MLNSPRPAPRFPITVPQLLAELGEQATVKLMTGMCKTGDFNFMIVGPGCVRQLRLMIEAELDA